MIISSVVLQLTSKMIFNGSKNFIPLLSQSWQSYIFYHIFHKMVQALINYQQL